MFGGLCAACPFLRGNEEGVDWRRKAGVGNGTGMRGGREAAVRL